MLPRVIIRVSRSLLFIAALGAVLSCSDKSTEPTGPRIRSLQVFPNPASIRVDETLVMVVMMDADSTADQTLEWRSADPRRVSVTETGIVTGVSVGPAVVTVQSIAFPSMYAAIPINVTPAYTGVHGFNVSPSSISLLPGQSQVITATVDADPKVSRDVTYAIDNTDIATVTPQGVISAITVGTARLTVTSVADPSASAVIGVTVRTPSAATISIQSLTAGGTSVPVDLANVQGQIDAVINIDAGEAALERVNLVATNNGRDTVVASQNFAASLAAARAQIRKLARTAADSAAADHATAPIVLSFRTNSFNPTSGTVAFRNGPIGIKAVAVSAGVGAGTQQEASSGVTATLNNLDGFVVSARGLSSTGISSATDVNGRRWMQASRGLVITSIPVMFSGRTVGARTISFPGGSPAGSITSTAPGESVDTLMLPAGFSTTMVGDGYLNGEFPTIIAANDQGNAISLVPALGSGNGAGVINAQPNYSFGPRLEGIRIDNASPPAPTFVLSTSQKNTHNWVNGAYKFASGLTGLGADVGVGLPGSNTAPTPESAGVAFLVVGNQLTDTTEVSAGADLAASSTNNAYTALVRVADRLGNTRLVPLTGTPDHPLTTFGVDLEPPILRYAQASPTGKTIIPTGSDSIYTTLTGVNGPYVYAVDAIDDRSGLAENQVSVALSHYAQPNTPGTFNGTMSCIVGTTNCNAIEFSYESILPDQFRQYTLPLDGGSGLEGYYTFTATVRDQAGNVSVPRTKRVLYDLGTGASAAALTGIGLPGTLIGGQQAGFLVLAADNVELGRGGIILDYPNLPDGVTMLAYQTPQSGGTAVGTPFDLLLTSPLAGTSPAFTVTNFIRGLEVVTATGEPQAYPAATAKPTAVTAWIRDLTPGSPAASMTSPIGAAAVQSPGANPGFAAAVGTPTQLDKWQRSGTSGLAFEAVGPSGQTVSPFVRVLLIRQEPSGLTGNPNVWRIVSELTIPVGTDNGIRRAWTYSFGSQGGGTYAAIGVTASGDAIVTQTVTP